VILRAKLEQQHSIQDIQRISKNGAGSTQTRNLRREGRRARYAGKLSKHNAAGQGVDYGGVRDLALSADGKYLACGGLIEASNPLGAISNPAVLVFDWQAGEESKLLRPKENVLGLVSSLRFHPSGFYRANGSIEKRHIPHGL
jgi:hypothetical protein